MNKFPIYIDTSDKEHRSNTCPAGDGEILRDPIREVSRYTCRGAKKCRICFPLTTVNGTYILRKFDSDQFEGIRNCKDDRCRMSLSPECACRCLGHFHGADVPKVRPEDIPEGLGSIGTLAREREEAEAEAMIVPDLE